MSAENNTQELHTTQVITPGSRRRRLSAASRHPPALVLVVGPAIQIGKQWELGNGEVFIGRDETCQIVVQDRSISARHARVWCRDKQVFIDDLGSTNGTLVGQRSVKSNEPVQLQDNEQIILGNVVFKYLAEGNLDALRNKQVYHRTTLDALTNIFNRRGLEEYAHAMVKSARTAKLPVCVIVFDIDDFKRVNDTLGHQCGDYVLTELVAVIRYRVIREGDLFARFGGEEFCLLLTATDIENGALIAERLRAAVADGEFCYGDWTLNVTVSVGVAGMSEETTHWEELFGLADRAMLESKRNGKNRVTVAGSLE